MTSLNISLQLASGQSGKLKGGKQFRWELSQ